MKRHFLPILLCLQIVLAFSCGASKSGSGSATQNINVNDAFKKVYDATQQALVEAGNTALKVASIDLTFATTTTTTTGGGITLWVLSGKYSRSRSTAKTATFTFAEDEGVRKAIAEDEQIKEFKDHLISVLKSANSIQRINTFGLSEVSVEVEFTINRTGEAALEIELSPVTPSLSRAKEREYTHTMTLNLKKR